jgi:3-oxoacyl-[acyl-carrier protein] reductase
METGLRGKTVLVTGASRNMGRMAALMFAKEGANLAICTSQRMDELNAVADEARSSGVTVLAEQCDVSDGASAAAFVSKAVGKFGSVDVAINLAGHRCEGKLLDLTLEAWNRNLEVNLTGPFHICRNVLPSMMEKRWGRIINIAGVAPYIGGDAAKAMVKLGVVGFTRGLAAEFAEYNITANCVGPGTIDRPYEEGVSYKRFDEQPIKRPGRPEEVIALIMHLAGESSGYTTGQCYLINGGRYFQ